MKFKRSLSISAATLLLVGAMSFVGVRVFAQASPPPAPATTQSAEAEDHEVSKGKGPDTDNVEEQVEEQIGDQNTPDSGVETDED